MRLYVYGEYVVFDIACIQLKDITYQTAFQFVPLKSSKILACHGYGYLTNNVTCSVLITKGPI